MVGEVAFGNQNGKDTESLGDKVFSSMRVTTIILRCLGLFAKLK